MDFDEDVSDNGNENDGGSGGSNPAWNDLLGAIPQEHHQSVIPHLQKWDQGFNSRLQQEQQRYSPYKQFVEQGVNAQDLQMGYGILQALNEDPEKVYKAIAEHYGLGATETEEIEEEIPGNLPPEILQKLQGFEQFQDQVSRLLVTQRENELALAAEDKLDKELSGLASKYGEFDERIVLPLMQNGMPAEEAVKQYFALMDNLATKASRPKPPRIIGSGGSIPQGGIDPTKLSSQETKNLVIQQLLANQQQ